MDCFVVIGKGNRKWYYILVFISDLESEAEMMEGNCVVKWAGGGVIRRGLYSIPSVGKRRQRNRKIFLWNRTNNGNLEMVSLSNA